MQSLDQHSGKPELDQRPSDPNRAGSFAEQPPSTVDKLQQDLETFELALRHPVVTDPFQKEAACTHAVELACLVGLASGSESVATQMGNTVESTAPTEIGREIGAYQLLSRLGSGGMGTVYKALHRHLGKVVALKVLQPDRLQSDEMVSRFQREMRAIGKVDHPHLIHALDAGTADGAQFLVMEYLDGLDLATLIQQRGRLSVADACEMVRQAALGLQAAHSRGLVHRDIKPANLMLARQEFGPPVVKVLDLGLALLSETHAVESSNLSQDGRIMGTINYMAPEQAGDSHAVDIRADIYSLGATLYALLTGGSIFQASPHLTVIQKLSALANDSASPIRELRPEITLELANIVHRMLARNPDERFSTPAEVSAALQPYAKGADLVALLADDVTQVTDAGSSIGAEVDLSATGTVNIEDRLDVSRKSTGTASGTQQIISARRQTAGPVRGTSRNFIAFGLAGIALLGVILLTVRGPDGEIIVELPDDLPAEMAQQLKVEVSGNGELRVADATHGWTIGVKSGKYDVQVTGGSDRIQIDDKQVTVTRGKQTYVTVKRKPVNSVAQISATMPPTRAIAPFSTEQAATHQSVWAKHLGVPLEFTNSIGMKFRLVPPGEFLMGSTRDEVAAILKLDLGDTYTGVMVKSESPKHKTILTEPYYLGTYEVTQQEFATVTGANPSAFSATGSHKNAVADMDTSKFPVDTVAWNDAVEFCAKLSHREELDAPPTQAVGQVPQVSGEGYRLPTEAEWEFACRAGTTTRFWSGDQYDDLQQVGRHRGNGFGTHRIGTGRPNPFGLYDVHGNVTEYVRDGWNEIYFHQFEDIAAVNPTGVNDPAGCLIRGGNWSAQAAICRSASRYAIAKTTRNEFTGFRAVLSLKAVRLTLERENSREALAANPDRRAATWLRSLQTPVVFDVVLSDGRRASLTREVPLPVTPFRIQNVSLLGPDLDALGDRFVEVLAEKFQGVHLHGVIIQVPTLTMKGFAKLVELPAFSEMSTLSLGSEMLNDGAFAELAKLTKLRHLDLGGAGNLTGQNILTLQACSGLTTLSVKGSRLSPEALDEIGRLPKLTLLDVDGLVCSEAHFVALGKLKVNYLGLNHTGFDDKLATHFPDMESRETLNLYGNPLTDLGLADLQRMKSLKTLILFNTQVTQTGVEAFRKAVPNCEVRWEPRKE
ncbi:MAG: Serine/threonine protein kinaserelated protein [Planctomycetaceae bacterium]|nr:Serine/threonine protein kinaserelated protein [Planctomycetaceae bacterium]